MNFELRGGGGGNVRTADCDVLKSALPLLRDNRKPTNLGLILG